MTYVAWAALYEGASDAAYFDVLIPRLMEELVIAGTRSATIPNLPAIRLKRAGPQEVASEACKNADAFFVVFIHADAGGRGLARGLEQRSTAYCEAMRELCNWPTDRCVVIAPRHETEAWVLADPAAVTEALGYTGTPASVGLPMNAAEAERVADPKAILEQAIVRTRGRRRGAIDVARVFPAIARRQNLTIVRRSESFRVFQDRVRVALNDLGCL
jgi:hypothetical protein